jgi:hypothetical protein
VATPAFFLVFVGNYTLVNSGLKAMYLTADLLWRIKTHKENLEFLERSGMSTKTETAKLIATLTELIEKGQIA